jgi:fumarylacetoacetate (FAA) hydrolase family protein
LQDGSWAVEDETLAGLSLVWSDSVSGTLGTGETQRASEILFEGETTTATMKRTLSDLANYLTLELDFPHRVFLMTGTCLVPGNEFTLQPGDVVLSQVGPLTIENRVSR